MTTETRNTAKGYTEQLSDFESQLRHTLDDKSLQQGVFRAIRELLQSHQQSESDIRQILKDRYESGQLRKETMLVVQQMLDRVSDEFDETLPDADEDDESEHVRTTILPSKAAVKRKPQPQQQLQAGSVLRDRFLLQHKVAGGSMGEVYKALDRRMAEVEGAEPWVAIKVLNVRLSQNAAALRAIQQEAAKGRSLTHPNIVRFIDFDREDGLYFLVMEWLDGQSLAAVLDHPESRQLPLDKVINIVDQLADALDYAHRRGVIHADVKPGNVMLTPVGDVKLIDFGIARIRQSNAKRPVEQDPQIPGAATPAYSSMQVLTGEEPVPADDVFSLACLTYRLLAGYRVFGPRNAAEAAAEGMAAQCPQGLSEAQWRVLKKALSFSRVTRFSSAREFVDDFIRASKGAEVIKVAEPLADEQTPVASGGGFGRAFIAVMGIAVLAAVAITQTDLLQRLGIDSRLNELMGRGTVVESPDVLPVETTDQEPVGASQSLSSGSPPEPETTLEDDQAESTVSAESQMETIGEQSPEVVPEPDVVPTGIPIADEVSPDSAVSADSADSAVSAESASESFFASARKEPTHAIRLLADAGPIPTMFVVLREDGAGAVLDIERTSRLDREMIVAIEERRFDGNGSPWESGQYQIAGDGSVSFAPNQAVAQLELSMTSDPLREPDRRAELLLRDALDGNELAVINLTLEDDDQRAFEERLAPNTVGFAVSQVSVAEGETAAQIDLVRYKPDQTTLRVAFDVLDVTATSDVDYFAPATRTVTFDPGQRSARILIPLVQDANREADEAFLLELVGISDTADGDIFRRIAVMIRDDDQ